MRVTLNYVQLFHSPRSHVPLNSHSILVFQLLMELQVYAWSEIQLPCSQLYLIPTVQTMDYGAIDVIMEFDTCETQKCVSVSIVNDLVDEGNKIFTYHLRRTTNLDARINLEPIDGTVEITDDDGKQ